MFELHQILNKAMLLFFVFILQAVAYNRDEFVRRRFRVLNLLAEMFESADWLIVHTPFIYSGGVTKSVVLCDVRAYFHSRISFRKFI